MRAINFNFVMYVVFVDMWYIVFRCCFGSPSSRTQKYVTAYTHTHTHTYTYLITIIFGITSAMETRIRCHMCICTKLMYVIFIHTRKYMHRGFIQLGYRRNSLFTRKKREHRENDFPEVFKNLARYIAALKFLDKTFTLIDHCEL